jgi:hypothetical protein
VKTFVDANIQITPQNATNPVNTNHTLTGHVNVNDGSGGGFVNAPAGTMISFSLTNSNGASATFVGPSSCATVLATGSCTVVITSPTGGTTDIKATTTVSVAGVSLTRTTGDGLAGDSPDAIKNWASARISITPSATNEVGVSHTFTVTLEKDTGGGFVPAAGEHVDVTLTDSNGAAHTAPTGSCTTAGANTDAAGQCTITFTSPTAGKVTGNATSTLNINGASITVTTNGTGGNSGPAVKTFVDANIQISPLTATNPVGTNHTIVGHVNVNDGSGAGFVNAPNGTTITFSLTNANGATATFVGPSSCTTAGGTGSCTVVISSPTAGQTTIHATTTVTVGGVPLTRSTGDGHVGDTPDAVKNWVAARISITPNATNEVGQPHTFTVLLEKNTGGGFVPAAGEHVDVTLTDSNGAAHTAPTGSCTTAGANTNAAGQCVITFTSPSAGKVTGHATATLTINGVSITVATDGTNGNSGDAVKTFVDANIQISPLTAANEIGTNHTLTGHVNVNDGSGAGFVNAPAGTVISFSLTNANGATAAFVGPTSCTTLNATGSCIVVISSPTPGSTTIHASTTVSVGGVSLTRATADGHAGDSADATKAWVDANIQISPLQATNPVNTNHTLTGHVNVNAGGGAGFVNAPDGTVISFTLTNAGGASATFVGPSSCTTPGAGAPGSGSCTVVISSPTAGTTTIHATTTVSVAGVSLTRATNGVGANSGDATKIWLSPNANIQISPLQASNAIGTNHTLTGHVNVSTDNVNFTPAPAGTVITFTLTNSNGATAAFVGPSTCSTIGATGSCTVVISSPTPGTTVIHAATDVTVSGTVLHRETDGVAPNSGNANKNWVDANIQITPATANNPVGATHTVTGHVNVNTGSGFVNAPDGTQISFAIASGPGTLGTPNPCTTTGGTGSCTITLTSNTTGTTVVNASTTVTVSGVSLTRTTNGSAGNSGPANKNWEDDVVTTTVRDAANNDITNNQQVTPGTVVHDTATVAEAPGTPAGVPAPTGTVTFTLFANGTCTAPPQSTDANEPLNASGVATSVTFTTPAAAGSFSYLAHYNGDPNYPAHDGPCEPFTTSKPFAPQLSPGYWKNHGAATQALLPLSLGNHVVSTYAEAKAIFEAMKCSTPINCLAAHLLAAKLDVASGSNPNITPVINQADALLIAVNYAGVNNFTTPTAAQNALANQLAGILDSYTNA